MKKELKDLLHILLLCIIKNGEIGINNAIVDVDVDFAEYEFDYLLMALTELKHLENGEEVDFKNVKDALRHCNRDASCTKEDIKCTIEWYKDGVDYETTDYHEYDPSDEILDELVELFENKVC